MASLLVAFLVLQFLHIRADGGYSPLESSLVADSESTTNACYSQSKEFAFGFYPQGTGYVVAIWLNRSGENTVVWTAYRDDPPVSPNATLRLTQRKLVLSSERDGVNKTIAADVSSAVMMDTGNFVLYDDKMGVVWQSFDYPTDSILKGQSLSAGRQLVSSFSRDDYSSGRFRIKMQKDGNLVMYPMNTEDDHENCYWYSDTDRNLKIYLYLNDTGLLLTNGTHTINDLYSSIQWSNSYMSRARLGHDGIFRLYVYDSTDSPPTIVWKKPEHPCDVKNFCGFNSYCTMDDETPYCVCLPGSDFQDPDWESSGSSGCVRNFTKPTCESGKENMTYYTMVTNEGLECDEHPYYQASIDTKDACSVSCLEDCDCDAAFFTGSSCKKYKYPLRYIYKRMYRQSLSLSFFKTHKSIKGPESSYVSSMENREVKVTTGKKSTWLLILVISLGFSIYSCISLSLTGFFIFKLRLQKYKRWLERKSLGLAEDLVLQSYTYKELKKATQGFKHELGRGSFGRVYKGRFYKRNKVIAVKRLEKMVEEGEKEFRAEMQVIGKTHHRNLVRLLGFCAEKTERLLVYEYMSNGTLGDRLFRSESLPNWSERVQIALDVARGVLYLHEECKTPIIHCDIKPQNILMDDFWTAKISDFGLAKLLMPDQTKTFTIVRGTRGYLAPEWQKNTPISVKVDIFSYGIVLLETICCRRNLEIHVSNTEEIVLSTWVYKCFERGQLDLLVGEEQVDMATLERLVKVGLWCIQDEPALRPSMKSVLLMLEGITDIAIPPCPTSVW